jgi:hypothetical protein
MERDARINCSTFQKQKSVIKDITDKMNGAKGVLEKAGVAEGLEEEVEMLLRCHAYESQNLNCKNCHFISTFRKKTSHLIMKANILESN